MANTTVNLGMLPQNRGEYSSSATYYKDNIVQYNGSSYICTATMDLEHPSGITGVAPYDSDPATPNTGWAVFSNDSSGVGEGVYNVSVDHTTDNQPKVYANLSAALNDIPAAKQKGGMSIKFIQGTVQNNDHKYVQCRLMTDEWSANTDDWAIAEEGVYVENPEFVKVYTDNDNKILWAIRADGGIYWGAGVPQQVVDYVQEKIAELSLDEYEDIVTFLGNLIEGDTLNTLLNGKVDKVKGESLINAEFADSQKVVENTEYLQVTTDSNSKIIQGIKSDGTSYIATNQVVEGDLTVGSSVSNAAVEINTTDNLEYIDLELDSGNKILGGRKVDGTKVENCPIETPNAITFSKDSDDYLEVTTDNEGKVIEGVTLEGKKHISDFDETTKGVIRDIVSNGNNVIRISKLNETFVSPIPCTVTGTKGNDNASYDFELPLSNDAYNIRFKFRITENLINQEKNAVIASINGVQVTATSIPLVQCVAPISFRYEGEYKNVNWPTLYGGISFNSGSVNKKVCKQHLGQEAFSIKYLGTDSASIENTGEAIVLTVGGTATSYNFSTYPTVSELYAAIADNADFELSHIAMDKRDCNELAIFTPVTLRDTFYCDDQGTYGGSPAFNPQPRIDNPPFYLRYAVSDEWHQVEIVKIGNAVYNTCDGNVITSSSVGGNNHLVLGGECGVLFKDIEIHANSVSDAEICNGNIVSSVNPYIVIFEAHGMYDGPAYTAVPSETDQGMSSQNIETMDYILSDLKRKGYVPVSIKDIAQWCVGNNKLPKRCYTLTFDDYRWPVCLNLNLRCVFNRYGAKPALVLVTDRTDSITYDGETITKEEAVKICYAAGFDIVSHTHNHRSTYGLKPSQYKEWLQDDIYAAEKIGTDGCIIVFPGGATDEYMGDVMEDVGIKCGIGIPGENPQNNTLRNRFYLSRIDISYYIRENGTVVDYSTIMNRIY